MPKRNSRDANNKVAADIDSTGNDLISSVKALGAKGGSLTSLQSGKYNPQPGAQEKKTADDIILYFAGRSLPMKRFSDGDFILALYTQGLDKRKAPVPVGCTNISYGTRDPTWDLGIRIPRSTVTIIARIYTWDEEKVPENIEITDLPREKMVGKAEIYMHDIRNAEGFQLARGIHSHFTFKMKKPRVIVRIGKRVMTRRPVPHIVDSKSLLLKSKDELADSSLFSFFLLIAALFVIADQVLISFKPQGDLFYTQLYLLAGSSLCWLISLVLSYMNMPYTMLDPEDPDLESATIVEPSLKLIQSFSGEVFYEAFFLAVGWVCLFFQPGLSPFRSFRLLRFMWYIELIEVDEEDFYFFLIQAARNCTKFLSKVGNELFFAARSKGGSIVIALFLYISYITGVVFWIEMESIDLVGTVSETACDRIDHCMFTMMRLAFYDEAGLDFIRSLMDLGDHRFLVILLVAYLFLTSFILLNGLIGIFGDIFSGRNDIKKGGGGGGGGGLSKEKEIKINQEANNANNAAQRSEINDMLHKLTEKTEKSNNEVLEALTKLQQELLTNINKIHTSVQTTAMQMKPSPAESRHTTPGLEHHRVQSNQSSSNQPQVTRTTIFVD
mmetsp:Transcript_6723/g.6946  ORF Transcript_6723/g.6946 Transcript_6723/m.6946 type:complete len:612 (+) Transcript_6723:160-1995(+)